MKIKTYLPVFTGFYYTKTAGFVDSHVECKLQIFEENGENNYSDLDFDYLKFYDEIGKVMTSYICEELKEADLGILNLTFDGIWSPSEYNFNNDKIKIVLELKSMDKINKFIEKNRKLFEQFLIDNFTPYDGFIPFVSTNYNDWIEIINDPNHRYYTGCFHEILNFICEILEIDEEDLISELDLQCVYELLELKNNK